MCTLELGGKSGLQLNIAGYGPVVSLLGNSMQEGSMPSCAAVETVFSILNNFSNSHVLLRFRRLHIQGAVTPIDTVVAAATGVTIFDQQKNRCDPVTALEKGP